MHPSAQGAAWQADIQAMPLLSPGAHAMSRNVRRFHPSLLMLRLGLLAWGACAGLSAGASEDHEPSAHASAAAAPKAAAAKAEAAPASARSAAPADSMDALRQKLAERLGAVKAPEAKSPYVLRVANKAVGEPEAPRVRAAGHGGAPAAAPGATGQVAAERPASSGGHAGHWDYSGENGPASWASLKPEYAQCGTGSRQSPIDIRAGIQVQLTPIQFDYQPTGFSVVDNGHTVQVNLPGGNAITVNGRRYDLVQFHFHRPSEERVNGRQFDMVAHLVHKDPEGRLAVVAVLLERGAAQPLIQAVWNALPLEKGEEMAAQEVIDLRQLLPNDARYYTYMGSLTTPPCSEGVLWLVMKQPVQVSNEQIGIFARLYPMNARPIQPQAGRLIKEAN
jgi:carbonic anhydrase